ncbi:DUF2306 domain-containing protein [Roseovarius sp. MMSF_3281]|uniref:DUF2306 domain-containing protein n=1 Tax=Roseovarius sp. MMSF_3281 TaxID=3046694 RepID=UPI00273E72B5|nr:DUF2306 domain-containing protein [Roseovarius sp. MMSF_3281]
MTWQPLWNDGLIVSAHALAALVAMGAGAVQFAMPKGTKVHLVLGYSWVGVMALVAGSSFWIHEFKMIGPYSPIHILSVITLVTLWYAIRAARACRIKAHRSAMLALYITALMLAGAFTLIPGRTMHAVLFGA